MKCRWPLQSKTPDVSPFSGYSERLQIMLVKITILGNNLSIFFVYAPYYQHIFTAFLLRICYHVPSAVETRKYIYTIQADEVASLCDGRLERKRSELHRNGKGSPRPEREVDDPVPRCQGHS